MSNTRIIPTTGIMIVSGGHKSPVFIGKNVPNASIIYHPFRSSDQMVSYIIYVLSASVHEKFLRMKVSSIIATLSKSISVFYTYRLTCNILRTG